MKIESTRFIINKKLCGCQGWFNSAGDVTVPVRFVETEKRKTIFRCTNNTPIGACSLVKHEGLPSDYYLRLTDQPAAILKKKNAPEMLKTIIYS